MTDNTPKICAAFEMWQNNDCIKASTTLELVMRYLADDPEMIDHVVSNMDQDRAYRDYIGRQNEKLNVKTSIIQDLNKNRTDVLSVSRATIDNLEAELKTAKSDYEIMRTNYGNMIAKLQNDIAAKDRAHTLDMDTIQELWGVIHDFREGYGASRLFVDAVLIRNLKGDSENLKTTIEDLNSQLTDERAIIDKITRLRVDEVETRQGLEADRDIVLQNDRNVIAKLREDIRGLEVELSARKDDSAVLMKVVDIVKNWDDSTGRAFPTLFKILDELVDYTDAPEGPETPIDDLYKVTVSCAFLEMP